MTIVLIFLVYLVVIWLKMEFVGTKFLIHTNDTGSKINVLYIICYNIIIFTSTFLVWANPLKLISNISALKNSHLKAV